MIITLFTNIFNTRFISALITETVGDNFRASNSREKQQEIKN